jgi:hypothetical protein
VIRIFLGPRLVRSARKLGAESRAKAEAALTAVARHFGDPHRHSGLGLRKIGSGLWECRVDIRWRIVLTQEADRLRAFDIMDHNEIRVRLKSRKR